MSAPSIDFDRLDLAALRRRRGEKWQLFGPDVLPAWVAEMDFPLCAPVRRVLESALEIDDLGYPLDVQPDALPAAFAERMESRFGWRADPRRVEVLTDVVQGIYVAIDQFSAPGEGVVVQTPVYPPFLSAVRELAPAAGRERRWSRATPRYEIDVDQLRAAIDPTTRVFLLCNPQNPTGRVFERARTRGARGDRASRTTSWSSPTRSTPISSTTGAGTSRSRRCRPRSRRARSRSPRRPRPSTSRACAAPIAHFGSDALRKRFDRVPRHMRGGLGSLGQAATLAAWREGQPWLDAVLAYLDGNRRRVARFVAERLPGVRSFAPEATFLAWLDCRALELEPSPQKFFLERARVALSEGSVFGTPGRGFARLNFATSRPLLDEISTRIEKALRERGAR